MADLRYSESFTNDAATGSASFPTSGAAATASASQSSATIAYDAATSSYAITVAGRTQTFQPSDLDSANSTASIAVYVRKNGSTTDTLTLTKAGDSGRFTYRYVAGGFWQRTITGTSAISGSVDAFAYGVETPNTALPRAGRAEYAVDLIGVETSNDGVYGITGQGSTQIDFASGAVITHGMVDDRVKFSSEAMLSNSGNSFSGNFRFDDFGEFTGNIDGRLFGPQAQEIGAAFSARLNETGNERVVVGSLIGRGTAVNSKNSSIKSLTVSDFFVNDSAILKTSLTGTSGRNDSGQTFSSGSAAAASLIVNYDAGSKAYTLIAPDRSQYFLGSRGVGFVDEQLTETTPKNSLAGFPYSTFTDLKYVASRRWTTATGNGPATQYRIQDFVYGVATPDNAMPRTGTAGYAIGVTGIAADANFPNLTNIAGFGFLTADFATGTLAAEGQMLFTEDWYISGRRPGQLGGRFSASATISSSANSFSGPISFDGLGSYSGTMKGRFFGSAAEEVGASFSATDGAGGFATGTFVGGLDPAATAATQTLATLSSPTNLAFTGAQPGPDIGSVTSVSYDPSTRSYSVTIRDTHLEGSPVHTVSLTPTNRDEAAGNASIDVYRGTLGGAASTTTLLKPGPANPTLALTYTSLATIIAPRAETPQLNDPLRDRYYVAFGIPTPNLRMPVSGTGTFNGIAKGAGRVTTNAFSGGSPGSVTSYYDVDGKFSLTADFINDGFTSKIELTGTEVGDGSIVTLPTMNITGNISGNQFSGGSNGYSMGGRFFGPNAEEIAGAFDYHQSDSAGTLTQLSGAVIGKR